MLALADTVGSHLGDPKRAIGILSATESEIRKASDSALDAQHLRTRGGLQYMTRQYAESEKSLRRALEPPTRRAR